MAQYQRRRKGFENEKISNVNDEGVYTLVVKLRGSDKENLRKALVKYQEDLGFLPSNPLMLSYLLRNYVK